MKNKKRLILTAITATFVLGGMTGCGKPTPVSIAADVVKTLEKIESVDGTMELSFSGKVSDPSDSSLSLDMDLNMNMDFQSTVTPEEAAYMNMELNLSLLGMNYDINAESYTIQADDGYEVYTCMQDTWVKQTVENFESQTESLMQADIYRAIAGEKLTATLDEELQKVNKKDAYLLHVSLDGEYLDSLFSSLGDMGDELFEGDMDFSDTTTDADIYIYKDANVLAKMEIDLTDISSQLMSGISEDASFDVTEYTLTLTMNSYNTVDVIKVPDNALRDAVETDSSQDIMGNLFGSDDDLSDDESDSDDFDTSDLFTDEEAAINEAGNYIITNSAGDLQAEIGVPDNYEYAYSTPNALSLEYETDEISISLQYAFDDFTEMSNMAAEYSDYSFLADEDSFTNITSAPETTTTVNGREIHYITVSYVYADEHNCIDCYAWTEASTGVPFLVEMDFFPYEENASLNTEELIQTVFSKITL